MGNTDNNKSTKYRSKIRIRLTDPNIPDSYVCEIFDSSLEDEEKISEDEQLLSEEKSKPKNYFEVLMSKKFKKFDVLKTSKEKGRGIKDDDESFEKSRRNQKNKKSLSLPEHSKKEKRKLEIDTSEDESLLQVQKNCKSKSYDAKDDDEDCIVEVLQETTKLEKTDKTDPFTIFSSSKVDLSQKKTFNILNYFTKTEVSLKKIKLNEEITAVQNAVKISQAPNSLKRLKKNSKGTAHKEQKIFLTGINKENVKLAPLFYKKENTVIDAAQQKARLDFLYKSPSTVVKKSDNETFDNFLEFPKIPHVQQRNDSICWSQRDICLPLRELCYSDECRLITTKKFNLKIEQLSAIHNIMTNKINFNKELFHKAKCKYLKLNLNLVIDGLKKKNERFLAQGKELEKLNTLIKKQDVSNEIGFEELNTLWTEKYKPNSIEILGNENVVKKFKKWLQSWKCFDEELNALAKSNKSSKKEKETNTDSDDDFLISENGDFQLKAPTNVCIISGPNGCGKTALVYALASELEFNVLELNASSKRIGKKVLSDLQEATQSHKVNHVNFASTETLQEVKQTKTKIRKKKKLKKPAKVLDQSNDSKISLILIEDADIVFDDHDEGFFSAITSLVQTSKRPLIFLSNTPDCQYLYSFKAEQCLVLYMEPPSFYKSCAVLDVVTQLEGAKLDTEFLESLICHNNFDLRKSLLHLQFWMHSSQNSADFQKHFDLGRLWWGLSMFLYKRGIRHFLSPKTRKRKRVSDLFDSSEDEIEMTTNKPSLPLDDLKKFSILKNSSVSETSEFSIESYLRFLDVASMLDRFCLPGSPEPVPGIEYKLKDSLLLDENMEDLFWARKSLTEQLSGELINLSAKIFVNKIKKNENEDRILNYLSPTWEEIRWRNSREKASEELSTLVSLQRGRDKRSLHVDYLPILRDICRIERNRAEMNPKRKNRFYHYLNNLGVQLNDENLEINCNVLYQ